MATVIRTYTQNHFVHDVSFDEVMMPTECYYTLLELSPKFIGNVMNDGSYTIRYPDGDYCVIDTLFPEDEDELTEAECDKLDKLYQLAVEQGL